MSNDNITPSWVPFEGYEGKLLRLIVVGINSFHSGRGTTSDTTPTENGETNGQYNQTDNEATPHVVFQFQNVPVYRPMNTDHTNADGYPASEMRKYLTSVTGYTDSGKFLLGLKNAGVPEGVLWAPKRYVSARATYYDPVAPALIEDVLWLPTERELFGKRISSVDEETVANQAWLEYYDDAAKRVKYKSASEYAHYWNASMYSSSSGSFCNVNSGGQTNSHSAGSVGGCASAFCVR